MKFLKFILKLFVLLIFASSIIFNILLFNRSYASLMFKKDIPTLTTMLSMNLLDTEDLLYTATNERGYKYTYTVEQDDKLIEKYEYKVYFDEDNVFNMTYTYTDGDDNETTVYVTNKFLYTSAKNSKTKKQLNDEEIENYKNSIAEKVQYIHWDIPSEVLSNEDDVKTSIDFSFSPFYLLGIEVELDVENGTDYTLHYDLTGSLKKVEYEEDDKDITITYSKNDSKIKYPDFKPYNLVE